LIGLLSLNLKPDFPIHRPVQPGAGAPVNRLDAIYGKLPLSFEANLGQTDLTVKFLSRGRGYALFLTGDEAVLSFQRASQKAKRKSQKAKVKAGVAPTLRSARTALKSGATNSNDAPTTDLAPRTTNAVLRLRLVGANASAAVVGAEELPGRANYFLGNDPRKWRTNVPTYARVKYQSVYPGIDLVYYGSQSGQLEYDFVVAPGADPRAIALDVGAGLVPAREGHPRGVPLRIAADGDLVVQTGGGDIRFHKPIVYQPDLASKEDLSGSSHVTRRSSRVDGRYILTASNQVRFALGAYDRSKPLVIDPVLSYSTYLGGSSGDGGYAIAVDFSGNAYVTGFTASTDFPTANPLQATLRGSYEVFVAKLNAAGSALVYSTYLGGSDGDEGYGIAVDSSGSAYVTGSTYSTDFPTVNALQAGLQGGEDAFVAKLNAAGSALVYSTYLGGSGEDWGYGMAVDSSGNGYVTGKTSSYDFPTANPFQSTCGSCGASGNDMYDAFVTKLNPAGSALVYSTYLGGSSLDYGNGIAVDSSGNTYVTGYTSSTDFPTVNPLQATNKAALAYNENNTAFVAKMNPTGSALVYSTYLGGSSSDGGYGIAADSSGNAYVTGFTASTDFPTASPLQASFGGGDFEVFVAKLNPTGSALVYSTYLGGSSGDEGYSIAVDSSGNAYVTGSTYSTDFPTMNPLQATNKAALSTGESTAFVTKLNWSSSALSLVYSTYLGGNNVDFGYGIAVDSSGNAYVTGTTQSSDFPTVNPLQASFGGGMSDAFVAKISPAPALTLSTNSLSFTGQNVSTTSAEQSVTLTNTGDGPLSITGFIVSGDFAQTNTCGASVSAGANCIISITFTPAAGGTLTGSVTVSDNAPGSPQNVALSGTGLDFTLAASPGSSTSATVAPGQSATYTLTMAGEGGFNQSVSFACTGPPSESTCAVSPNPATPGTNLTVTVTTTAPSASRPRSFLPSNRVHWGPASCWWLPCLLWAWLGQCGAGDKSGQLDGGPS
jgi:hypothetical protein